MAMEHMDLAYVRPSRQWVLIDAESAVTISDCHNVRESRDNGELGETYMGFGKYGLSWPMSWKMLAF